MGRFGGRFRWHRGRGCCAPPGTLSTGGDSGRGSAPGAFVAGELGERVGTFAIDVEGASQEVALDGLGGRGRHRIAVFFGVSFLDVVELLADLFLCGDIVEAVAIDAGFRGEGAVETPLVVDRREPIGVRIVIALEVGE